MLFSFCSSPKLTQDEGRVTTEQRSAKIPMYYWYSTAFLYLCNQQYLSVNMTFNRSMNGWLIGLINGSNPSFFCRFTNYNPVYYNKGLLVSPVLLKRIDRQFSVTFTRLLTGGKVIHSKRINFDVVFDNGLLHATGTHLVISTWFIEILPVVIRLRKRFCNRCLRCVGPVIR